MKTVIIYSGKGGVGKTTTTANIARTLSSKGNKVLVIDADINTPSMCTEFEGDNPQENLWVHSSGNMFDKFIYLEQAMVRKFLQFGKKKIKEISPDYVLVDTPPSITNVHIELLKMLKVSHLVFVSQPTKLSKGDVMRTANFFRERCGYCPASLVENMCFEEYLDEEPFDYGVEVVARIPMKRNFQTLNLWEEAKEEYENIVAEINRSKDIIQEDDVNSLLTYDEGYDILEIYRRHSHRGNAGYDLEILRDGDTLPKTMHLSELRFLSIRTWEKISDYLRDEDQMGCRWDMRMVRCDTERIRRLLEAFKDDSSAYFVVTQAPGTEIQLLTGEIGLASLDTGHNSYYNIPRIRYTTSQGSVTLFPDEVAPASMQTIQDSLEDGYLLRSDGRYMPSKEILRQIHDQFGSTLLRDNWEEIFDYWNNN